MPADPSPSQLPPEWVEKLAAFGFERMHFSRATAAEYAAGAGEVLTPLIAERWDGLKEACRREMAHHFKLPDAELIAERDQARAEARELCEALGRIEALALTDLRPSAVRAATIARAALSASPVSEPTPAQRVSKAAGNALARIEAGVYGPVSVPEQEEGRVAREWTIGVCNWPLAPLITVTSGPMVRHDETIRVREVLAAPSSSSEEGERATIPVSTLRQKLDEMELHDDLPDSHDIGYMACWRELRDWVDTAHEPATECRTLDLGDGLTARVHGAPDPSPESAAAIEAVCRAAAERWTICGSTDDDGVRGNRVAGPIVAQGEAVPVVAMADILRALRERLTSDEAVEVHARAAFERARSDFEYDWDATADQWRDDARVFLTAVASVLNDNDKEAGA